MTTTVLLALPAGPFDDRDTGTDVRDITHHLLRSGCRVVVAGRDIAELLEAVRGHGSDRAAVVVGDLSDPHTREALIDVATTCFGSIDHVVELDESIPDSALDTGGAANTGRAGPGVSVPVAVAA